MFHLDKNKPAGSTMKSNHVIAYSKCVFVYVMLYKRTTYKLLMRMSNDLPLFKIPFVSFKINASTLFNDDSAQYAVYQDQLRPRRGYRHI